MDTEKLCCICGTKRFREFRGRGEVQCAHCRSLERTRLMKLAIDQEIKITPEMKIIHFAPENEFARSLKKAAPSGYTCYDICPENYPEDLNPQKFDLTKDIFDLETNAYDLIIHSHVMEHIPCNLTVVLYHLHRALKPTGRHVFAVPIAAGGYRSNFSDMAEKDRIAAFNHPEHFRQIGRDDIDRTLGMIFDLNPYPFAKKVDPRILRRNNIPEHLWSGFHGSTIFMQDKASIKIG